jgi:Dolichyl-phosphate-mannose-protein mannosyltransferase
VLATLLYAFSPALVEVQSDVMTEGTFIFFLFSSMWLTWRMMERPSPERGIILGAAAAGAFLTRPEGLLALVLSVALPLGDVLVRRRDVGRALGGIGLTVVTMLLLLSPYLFWVKAERGRWALSVRPAAITAERAVGAGEEPDSSVRPEDRARFYRIYLLSMFRLSLYGLLIPFFLLGLGELRKVPWRSSVFYLSFPLGQLGGIALALRTATFMSERYILAGMALLWAVAAFGMVALIRAAARTWPESRIRPALCGAAILLLLLPVLKAFKVRRTECLSYPGAAQWILAHGPRPTAMTGLEQVAYYCGSRSYYAPREKGALLAMLDRQRLDYFVYSDKDVRNDPDYVAMLRSLDRLAPPVEIPGPPGTWTVYVQRVK